MAVNAHTTKQLCLRCRSFPGKYILDFLLVVALFQGVLFLGAMNLQAQSSPFDPGWRAEAAKIKEKLTCFTDRGLYVVEEAIRFSAILHDNRPSHYLPWSRVLYVELVSADGAGLASGKYPVTEGKAMGEIPIPADLLSGAYYLRAYTRWMRNFGPESYSYVPLRIVNPYRSEMVESIAAESADALPDGSVVHASMVEFNVHPGDFRRSEQVSMELHPVGGGTMDNIHGCVTVVPRLALPSKTWRLKATEEESNVDSTLDFQLGFLPDKYGPSISGSVVYSQAGVTKGTDSRIHFTLLGDTPGYLVCRPDHTGRFAVALPYFQGNLELFVQPESHDGSVTEVRIDRDFDQRHLSLPAADFAVAKRDRQRVEIMARNVQLSGIYRGPSLLAVKDTMAETPPFYGKPTLTVDMDRYVLLPTLNEVFLNLVPGVTPVKRRNRNSLEIDSENPALSMFDPLIMVDQVPVFDLETFLSISPAKIKRVDVVEDVYVKGDMRFGGLINLVSRDRDMAGIDLPDRSFFIDYLAMHPTSGAKKDAVQGGDRVPDTRNTLLWLPHMEWEEASARNITFTAPDYPGEYVVLFRGLGPGGELLWAETTFLVK